MPISNSYFDKRDFRKAVVGDEVRLIHDKNRSSRMVRIHKDCPGPKIISGYNKTPVVAKLKYSATCINCDVEFKVYTNNFEVVK